MRMHPIVTCGLIALACSAGGAMGASYEGALSGANEVPSNAGTASGFVSITYAPLSTLSVDLFFSGLTGPAVAAHIHCCITTPGTNAGVAVPMPGLPAATAGSYQHVFNLDDSAVYSSAFLSANGGTAASAKAALLAGMDTDHAYFNIHTSLFPGGEIRANLASSIFRDGFD
jgi:hypothetical protein